MEFWVKETMNKNSWNCQNCNTLKNMFLKFFYLISKQTNANSVVFVFTQKCFIYQISIDVMRETDVTFRGRITIGWTFQPSNLVSVVTVRSGNSREEKEVTAAFMRAMSLRSFIIDWKKKNFIFAVLVGIYKTDK